MESSPANHRKKGNDPSLSCAPIPQPFDFGLSARRPLVPLAVVTLLLDLQAKQVLALIEEGKLRWAFDIRSARSVRREVRVLRQSLFEYAGLLKPAPGRNSDETEEFKKIMDLVLPPGIILTPLSIGKKNNNFATPLPPKAPLVTPAFQNLLFPREPVLRGTEVAKCFSCLSQHVMNLLKEKTLQTVNLRREPKASPFITRGSLVKFLHERRMS